MASSPACSSISRRACGRTERAAAPSSRPCARSRARRIAMTSEKHVLFEVGDGVGVVTLNRPDRLNAVNWNMASELVALFRDLRRRDEVRVIVLTGAGKAFCSGGGDRATPGLWGAPPERYQPKPPAGPFAEFTRMIVEVEKPVIAAISGPAMGAGLAYALACDRRFADPNARLCAAMVRLGFRPACGITHF